jgi:hypothetical protein
MNHKLYKAIGNIYNTNHLGVMRIKSVIARDKLHQALSSLMVNSNKFYQLKFGNVQR